jgi:hypothetical protein
MPAAHADEIQFGFSLMDMNYREFDDNDFVLNREDGFLPGVTGQLTLESKSFDSSLHASYHTADIDYDGYTQSLIPVQTKTSTDILDIHYRLSTKPEQQFQWYGGVGYRYWRRNILPTVIDTGTGPQGVAGILEEYSWFYGLAGVKTNLYQRGPYEFAVDLRITHMLRAQMDIDFLGFQGLDDKTLDLGEQTNFRIGLPWKVKTANSYTWLVEAYFETWDIGKSNTVNLTQGGSLVTGCPGPSDPCGVLEPRSETRNVGITMQLIILL